MESKLLVEDRQVVIPGEKLAEGMDYLPSQGTYRLDEAIYSKVMGLTRVDGKVLKIVPLKGTYLPKVNDVVIAQITEIISAGWTANIFSPYNSMMPLKEGSNDFIQKGADLSRFFDVGDFVVVKITRVTPQKLIDISAKGPGLRRLREGRIFKVNSSKVPRIIGKQGSMISLIKEKTGTQITVGQNGMVWLCGEDPAKENLAEETIRKIEAEAHTSGLTDKIEAFLQEKVGGKEWVMIKDLMVEI